MLKKEIGIKPNIGKEDSLKKRYAYKLFTNFWGMGMGMITLGMTPRALGPAMYGSYSFLTNFFSQLMNFFDVGTSTGFYSKISYRQREHSLITFYFSFMFILALAVFLFLAAAFATSLDKFLWPGQLRIFILLAACFGLFSWISNVLNKITDAYALTIKAEMAKVVRLTIGTIFIVLLFSLSRLNILTLFILQLCILLIIIISFLLIINRKVKIKDLIRPMPWQMVKGYIVEFYKYSHPLLAYALVGLIIGLLDRWLLQVFAGSEQQGFYGLSYTIGSFCFMFTLAMQPLFMRELSILNGNRDYDKMAELFRRYIPLFYFIAAYFSCFIAINAGNVTSIIGGGKYGSAILPIAIMAFYPMHQTYGQLSGSVYYATERTSLYRNIGISMMFVGLPLTYILIAPTAYLGLSMGAIGLALKMVVLQLMAVNVQLYFNSKMLKLNYWKYVLHQLTVPTILVLIAFIIRSSLGLFMTGGNILFSFVISGAIYTMFAALAIYCFPMIIGMRRPEMMGIINIARKRSGV